MSRNSRMRCFVALCALVALAIVAAAPAFAVPNYEAHAYWSVVGDAPYAPYTVNDLKRTSLLPYWSVLH
jgi:opacity protein-like surface antigen